jgi:hypothetical protein
MTGKIKLLKLVFLSEARMNKNEIKGFNYYFYRWNYGPLSDEILQDLDCLVENGLLEKVENSICITSKGRELLGSSKDLLTRNEEILEPIRQVVREFGHYRGESIKMIVYGTPKAGEEKLVKDTEHGEELLSELPREEAKKWFLIDDNWIETLELQFDREACSSLDRGIQDARAGRVTKHKPINMLT